MNEHIQILPDKCRACHRCEMACIAAHHGIDMKEAMKRKDEFAASVHVVKTDDFKTSTPCSRRRTGASPSGTSSAWAVICAKPPVLTGP